MSTVLWGRRRGDLQYNSRDYWRQTIPIDPAVVVLLLESTSYFDVGTLLEYQPDRDTISRVVGLELPGQIGVRTVTSEELAARHRP